MTIKCDICREREFFKKHKGYMLCAICYKNFVYGPGPKKYVRTVYEPNTVETKPYKG